MRALHLCARPCVCFPNPSDFDCYTPAPRQIQRKRRIDLAGLDLAICSCGCGQSELVPSLCLTHMDTHAQANPWPLSWLSRGLYFIEPLTCTGTEHLAVRPAVSHGHVSGLLFSGSVVLVGRKKKWGAGGGDWGKAHIDSYPPATRQEAAFIILPFK